MPVVIEEMESTVEPETGRGPETRGSSAQQKKPKAPRLEQIAGDLRRIAARKARLHAD